MSVKKILTVLGAGLLLMLLLFYSNVFWPKSVVRLDIRTQNFGYEELIDVAVFYPDDREFAVGGLGGNSMPAGNYSNHSDFGFELPEQFRVEWLTTDGQQHSSMLDLPARESLTEPTRLLIAISGKHVELRIEKIEQP